jgi:hypothetical protein
MRGGTALVVVALATALPACGSGDRKGVSGSEPLTQGTGTRGTTTVTRDVFPSDPGLASRATTPRQRRELVQLAADLRRIRMASAAAPRKSLQGTPAVRASTTRFIDHEQRATLDNLVKNRVIDHAAAAVAPACEQCFQQLEAIRPIVDIAH